MFLFFDEFERSSVVVLVSSMDKIESICNRLNIDNGTVHIVDIAR
jgi:hypothetical protein